MIIAGLQKLTLIDYPAKIAATVFLASCNFRCPWCYSSELVLPEKIKKQPKISKKEFFDFLKEKKGLLEGVVICGGEPCLNPGLPGFIKKIKKLGFSIKLDTNGSKPKMLKKLIDNDLIDYVAMDIKLPKERYFQVLGVAVDEIEQSMEILKENKIDYEFRTTVVPTVLDKYDVMEIAKWISSADQKLGGQGKYYLQNFRPEKTIDPNFEKVKPYDDEYLLNIKETISPFFEICGIR
ncbi:MAG: anaerobic ribonucleoside-triphosphate reductase activating protein [bacterium]|nr:anaerobic ribonucleoside-triphosphate reductase activating protein [bacterium]